MKSIHILISTTLLVISSFAWSGEDYSQSSHNEGMRQLKDEADQNLNRTYKALMQAIESKESKAKLVKAQRAWLAYRDAACDFENITWEGSSSFDTFYYQCIEIKSKARTAELEESLKEIGGH